VAIATDIETFQHLPGRRIPGDEGILCMGLQEARGILVATAIHRGERGHMGANRTKAEGLVQALKTKLFLDRWNTKKAYSTKR